MSKVVKNLENLSDDELAELISKGQAGETFSNANSRRAAEELSRRRSFSTTPSMSFVPGLAGEVLRFGIPLAMKGTPIGRIFPKATEAVTHFAEKAAFSVDAAGNAYAATAGNPGGKSKYGFLRPVPTTGLMAPVDASGATTPSIAMDAAEGVTQAAQFTLAAPIGILTAGEGTEEQIQEAMRQRVPALRRMQEISYTGGDLAEGEIMAMDRAIQNLGTMNAQRPSYSGRTGEPLYQSIDEASANEIRAILAAAKQALDSGDERRINQAAGMIRNAAANLDRHYANMEAITDSTQEWTWPFKRFGEVMKDEIAPYFSVDRMFDTASGKIPYKGFGDWINPVGQNMTQYKKWQDKEVNEKKRNEGPDLLDEFDARALTATGGEDPVQVRNNKIMAEGAARAKRAPQPLGGPRKKKLLSNDEKIINE